MQRAGPPLLSVRRLELAFAGSKGTRTPILKGVELTVGQEEIVGLVGETGSGKSITAAAIMGLVPAAASITAGSVELDGCELLGRSEQELRELRGSQIALVTQHPKAALNPLLPVGRQILNVFRANLPEDREHAERRVRETLAEVGFEDPCRVAESYPHELSGGMAQRVVIAMALGLSPRLVIADEPTTGLDATVQVQVLDLFQRVVREAGASSLLITHDLTVVANYCDRVVVMHDGHVVEHGPVPEFFATATHPHSRRLVSRVTVP